MSACPKWMCLKVDVDTHDGMRLGVPRLLDAFAAHGVRATFFLSFGPDNSGKAVWNVVRRRGFLRKMLRTRAVRLYGLRTALSGTLLPARMIAVRFPEIVRRIAEEGHEVGVHAWDHRLWQDHLPRLGPSGVAAEFARSFAAFERILGRPPLAVAAPAWCSTATSLEVEDSLGLCYASDMRGGAPGYPELDGYRASTLQIPTTQPCLEELIEGRRPDLTQCAAEVLRPAADLEAMVVPLHAEVEGGIYAGFLDLLLEQARAAGMTPITLQDLADRLLDREASPPRLVARPRSLPGRSGQVLVATRETAHA